MNELDQARMKRERERLKEAEHWTPQEALEACLTDIKLGKLEQIECITVIVARSVDNGEATKVERYVGSNGFSGPKQTFWVMGMIFNNISTWNN